MMQKVINNQFIEYELVKALTVYGQSEEQKQAIML